MVQKPERFELMRETGASEALDHGFKRGDTTEVEEIDRSRRWSKKTCC